MPNQRTKNGRWVPATPLPEPRIWKLWRGLGLMRTLAALVACLGICLGVPATAGAGDIDGVFKLHNSHRAAKGLTPLRIDTRLRLIAQYKLARIRECGIFTHLPCGERFLAPFEVVGYPSRVVAENIAMGQETPSWVFKDWLSSPGHRSAIESPLYRGVGFAVGRINGAKVWVTEFGAALSAPFRVPQWYWRWAEWRLGRGEFRCRARAPQIRPPAPRLIPSWAWERLKLLRPGAC